MSAQHPDGRSPQMARPTGPSPINRFGTFKCNSTACSIQWTEKNSCASQASRPCSAETYRRCAQSIIATSTLCAIWPTTWTAFRAGTNAARHCCSGCEIDSCRSPRPKSVENNSASTPASNNSQAHGGDLAAIRAKEQSRPRPLARPRLDARRVVNALYAHFAAQARSLNRQIDSLQSASRASA